MESLKYTSIDRRHLGYFCSGFNASKSDLLGVGRQHGDGQNTPLYLIFIQRCISAEEKWRTFKQTRVPSIIQRLWTYAYALTQSQQTHSLTNTHAFMLVSSREY